MQVGEINGDSVFSPKPLSLSREMYHWFTGTKIFWSLPRWDVFASTTYLVSRSLIIRCYLAIVGEYALRLVVLIQNVNFHAYDVLCSRFSDGGM